MLSESSDIYSVSNHLDIKKPGGRFHSDASYIYNFGHVGSTQ